LDHPGAGHHTSIACCPGAITEMIPAHRQLQVQVLSNAGRPLTVTAGEPGTHGATVAGMQGCGAPDAAITCGLVGLLHSPNGRMFTIGAKSMIVAQPRAGLTGDAANDDGAAPNGQVSSAPSTT
jgi:hypothetical protein